MGRVRITAGGIALAPLSFLLSTVADSATARASARRAGRPLLPAPPGDGVAVEVVGDHRRAARHFQEAFFVEHVALGPAELEHLVDARRLVALSASRTPSPGASGCPGRRRS